MLGAAENGNEDGTDMTGEKRMACEKESMKSAMGEKGWKAEYEDLLYLPHHSSARHPRMSMAGRAAQFLPFAALSGYEGIIQETARLTDNRLELDESGKAALDEELRLLLEQPGARALFTYFRPDDRKAGGAYVQAAGAVKRLDEYEGVLILENGTRIPLGEIIEIEPQA